MTYHEKVWWLNIAIIAATVVVGVILYILTHGNMNVVMASFGLLGFIALPALIYRKKLEEEQDEMMRKIESKVIMHSFRITWALMFLAILLVYHLAPSGGGNLLVPVWALWGILWGTFLLTMLIQSIYGIYYINRGLGDED